MRKRRTLKPQIIVLIAAIMFGGFAVTLRPSPPVGTNTAMLHQLSQPIHPPTPPAPPIDCTRTPCVALTFDDGPNPITTPQILDILEKQQVHASFFVVGMRAATMPHLLQRMYHDGDEIGNHSWNHPDLTTISPEQIQAQVAQTQMAVMAAGVPAPSLFRPPYGSLNAEVRSNIPMTIAMWNIDPLDWNTKDPNAIVANVAHGAKPGGIIDMHDIYPQTVAALPGVLQDLKSRYQLVTMSQLLNLAPGQRGEYFGR
ncbi:MAG TPA: polysaccharide deacetylase family protein [Candidatus Saccharimonadales bacterium]|nr:polysaccharide deacetylase family protein [Candidatus Saccharimonadales bacterium]